MPSGRLITPLPERLRTMLWADSVMACCGAKTITEMERTLATKCKPEVRIASGLWSRYLRGEAAPAGARKGRQGSLVLRLGHHWPDTQNVFEHPIWSLLQWTPVINMEQMRRHYFRLGEPVRQKFYRMSGVGTERDHDAHTQFWHIQRTPDTLEIIIKEVAADPWMAITLALLEARMGFAAQRMERFYTAQVLACLTARFLFEDQSFNSPRALAAALVMQALCLEPILINIVQQKVRDQEHEVFREQGLRSFYIWRHSVTTFMKISTRERQIAMRKLLGQMSSIEFMPGINGDFKPLTITSCLQIVR